MGEAWTIPQKGESVESVQREQQGHEHLVTVSAGTTAVEVAEVIFLEEDESVQVRASATDEATLVGQHSRDSVVGMLACQWNFACLQFRRKPLGALHYGCLGRARRPWRSSCRDMRDNSRA